MPEALITAYEWVINNINPIKLLFELVKELRNSPQALLGIDLFLIGKLINIYKRITN